MSHTFKWCQDKTKLEIYGKRVFQIYRDGTKRWYLNGQLHRVNGPAVESVNGTEWWYLNGKIHRENGPAVERADGHKYWFLNDKCYSESAYWKELQK